MSCSASVSAMDRLLKVSQGNVVLPGELLYRDIAKVLSKGLANCSPDYARACARIFALLADQGEVEGVTNLVQYKDHQILQLIVQNFYELKEKRMQEHLEFLIDAIHMLVEFSLPGRKHCLQVVSSLMAILLEHDVWDFPMRLEVAKLINLMLEDTEIPADVRNAAPCRKFITEFGTCLDNAGDYEIQATVMETLFRIVTPQQKQELVRKWFATERLQLLFVNIRNEAFETDCRHFLNNFNRSDLVKQKVFSYPVSAFMLGKYKLQQPRDARVTEFWVDFNVCSSSISTFVNDDAAMGEDPASTQWEIVSIKKANVRDVCINPTVNSIVVLVKLREPACKLAPFCPTASEKYVKIVASRSSGILRGVEKIFGTVKQYVTGDSQESPNVRGSVKKYVSGGIDDSQDIRASQSRRTKCSIVVRKISLPGNSQEPVVSPDPQSESGERKTEVASVDPGISLSDNENVGDRTPGKRISSSNTRGARRRDARQGSDTYERAIEIRAAVDVAEEGMNEKPCVKQSSRIKTKSRIEDESSEMGSPNLLVTSSKMETETSEMEQESRDLRAKEDIDSAVMIPETMDIDEESEKKGAFEVHSVEVVPETEESEKKDVSELHSVEVVPETEESEKKGVSELHSFEVVPETKESEKGVSEVNAFEVVPETEESEKKGVSEVNAFEVVPETFEMDVGSGTVGKMRIKSPDVAGGKSDIPVNTVDTGAAYISEKDKAVENETRGTLEEKGVSDESINISADQSMLDSEAEEKKLMDTLKEKNVSVKKKPDVKPVEKTPKSKPMEEEKKSVQKSARGKKVSDETRKPRSSKKLLSIKKAQVFQDSPDETYQPAPVKDPESRQQRKTMSADNITAKMPASRFSFSKHRKTDEVADFEFDPLDTDTIADKGAGKEDSLTDKKSCDLLSHDNDVTVKDEKLAAPSKKTKGQKGSKKKKEVSASKKKPAPAPVAETETTLPRRTSRRTRKVVNYAEDTTKDEDTMESPQLAENEETCGSEKSGEGSPANDDIEMELAVEEEDVCMKEMDGADTSLKASNNKSVSFVSPLEETSYYEVHTPYSGSEKDAESPALREVIEDQDASMNTSLDISMEVDNPEAQNNEEEVNHNSTHKDSPSKTSKTKESSKKEIVGKRSKKKSKEVDLQNEEMEEAEEEEEEPIIADTIPHPIQPSLADTVPVIQDDSSRELALVKKSKNAVVKSGKASKSTGNSSQDPCPVELALVKKPKNAVVKAGKASKDSKGPSGGKTFKDLVRPFQKNVNLGWGKKVIPSSLLSAFDFDDEADHDVVSQQSVMRHTQQKTVTHKVKTSGVAKKKETRIEQLETSWTGQKLKKKKVKTEYKVKKSFKDRYIADQQSSQEEGGFSSQGSDSTTRVNKGRKKKKDEVEKRRIESEDDEEEHLQGSGSDVEGENTSNDDRSTHTLGKQKKAKLFYGNKGNTKQKKSTKLDIPEDKQARMKKKKSVQRQKLCELVGMSSPISSSQDSTGSLTHKPTKRKVLKKLPPPPPKDTTTDSSQEYHNTKRKPNTYKKGRQNTNTYFSPAGQANTEAKEDVKSVQEDSIQEEDFFEQVVPVEEHKAAPQKKQKTKSKEQVKKAISADKAIAVSCQFLQPSVHLMDIDAEFQQISQHELVETDDEFAKARKLQSNPTVIPDTYDGVEATEHVETVDVTIANKNKDEVPSINKEQGGKEKLKKRNKRKLETLEAEQDQLISNVDEVEYKNTENDEDMADAGMCDAPACDMVATRKETGMDENRQVGKETRDALTLRAEALISGLQENSSEQRLTVYDPTKDQELISDEGEEENKENKKPHSVVGEMDDKHHKKSTKTTAEFGSSEGSSSSVNASQEPAAFFETPGAVLNTFGVKDTRRTLEKTFENIEALTKRDVKRKLLKTPVVVLQEVNESIQAEKEDEQVFIKKKNTKKTQVETKRTMRKKVRESDAPVAVANEMEVQEEKGAGNTFSDFCKSVISTSSVKRPNVVDAEDNEVVDEDAANDTSMVISSSAETSTSNARNEDVHSDNRQNSPTCSKSVAASEERTVLEEIQLPTGKARMSETDKRVAKVTISLVDQDEKPASQSTTSCEDVAEFSMSNKETEEVSLSVVSSCASAAPPSQQEERDQENEDDDELHNSQYFTPCESTSDLNPLLNMFGSDFSKKLNKKKEAFERFSDRVTKLSASRLQQTWKAQKERHKTHNTSFQNTSLNELNEWEAECETKEKNLLAALDTLKRSLKEASAHERSKVDLLRKLNVTHFEEKEEMEVVEEKEQEDVQKSLREEVRRMREAELMKAKEQEMVDMRNALKTMLEKV